MVEVRPKHWACGNHRGQGMLLNIHLIKTISVLVYKKCCKFVINSNVRHHHTVRLLLMIIIQVKKSQNKLSNRDICSYVEKVSQ